MKKLIKKCVLLVFLSAFSSCSVGKLANLNQVGNNEKIIIGKARIIYNGQDLTENSNVVFSDKRTIVNPPQCILDSSGNIFAKAPRGKLYLTTIVLREGLITKNLGEQSLVADISGNNKVYYIGDIDIVWNGISDYEARRRSTAIALGAIGLSEVADSISLKVKSDGKNRITQTFKNNYNSTLPVGDAILRRH